MSVIFVKAVIYFLLYDLHDCTFNKMEIQMNLENERELKRIRNLHYCLAKGNYLLKD